MSEEQLTKQLVNQREGKASRAGAAAPDRVRPGPARPDEAVGVDPARRWLAFLLAYCLAYVLVRLAVPGTLERDEAEILYLTQEARLGYGTQPPLYAWLQWLAFAAFGVNRLALVLPKALLLACTYVALFRAARPLVGRQAALAAAAALALFPQIGWESLRIQTHSVLVTTLACATLWCHGALLARPGAARHALLGLLVGLGLQAKYNYGFFVAAVAVASLLLPGQRALLWTRRMWITAALATLVLLPHAAWMVQHLDAAFAGTLDKMRAGVAAKSYLERAGGGLLGMLAAGAAFAVLPLLVLGVLGWPWRRQAAFDREAPGSLFFLYQLGACCALLALLALGGEVGTVKDRWMIPLLFYLPLAVLAMFPALNRPQVCTRLLRAGAGAALCFLALLPLRIYLGPAADRITVSHYPYPQLAWALDERCPAARTVVTDNLSLAGNLRFARPAWRILLLEDALRERTPLAGRVVLVTHAPDMQPALAAFGALYRGAGVAGQGDIALPLRFGAGGSMGFAYRCVVLG